MLKEKREEADAFTALFFLPLFAFIIGICCGLDIASENTIERIPEVTLAAIVVAPPECATTYGPIPTPRDGWFAWGRVCRKGIEP